MIEDHPPGLRELDGVAAAASGTAGPHAQKHNRIKRVTARTGRFTTIRVCMCPPISIDVLKSNRLDANHHNDPSAKGQALP